MRPDLSVGFGSYVSYPGMRLSVWMKIPTLIHEQNLTPGKATQWLAPHVERVAVSFDDTFEELSQGKRAVTGLPLRSDLRSSFAGKHPKPVKTAAERFRILIVGGSQGASRINQLILDAFLQFSPEELKKIAVKHITGTSDLRKITEAYQKMNIQAETFAFHNRMQEIYGETDLAITRAGANTLSELSLFGVPAMVIPYPFAGAHQIDNARFFENRKAVIVAEEETIDAAWMAQKIREMMNSPESLSLLSKNIQTLSCVDADEQLVKLAEDLLKGRN